MKQIQDFKTELTDRIDKKVAEYRDHVAELELPQMQMQVDMKELKRKME